MIREPNPQKKFHKGNKRNVKTTTRTTEDVQEQRFATMTRFQFINWLKVLPNEERYLTLKVFCPKLVKQLLAIRSKNGDSWKLQMDGQKPPTKFIKGFMSALQAFIDGLVLISDEDYLDSVGFDFSFVGCPDKLYDTLNILTIGWNKLKEKKLTNLPEEFYKFLTIQKEDWITKILKIIQDDYTIKSTSIWDPSVLERQRNEKKQFGNFWKNLTKTQKINFLLQGHENSRSLIEKQIQGECNLTPDQLDDEIGQLLNLDKKQICNKVFKCKIKKCSVDFCPYYELVYKNWREFALKRKTQGKVYKNKQKPMTKRERSSDECSNQTNETQKKQFIVQVNQEQLYKTLQQDILECTDEISEASNKFYERRVLGFERIAAIFRLYNISCKLFGSCSSGITIKQSDIDIAINESILKMFEMQEDKKSQMGKAFQFMGQIFQSLPWVSKVKVIKTAAIPIIKLTIDTSVQVTQQFFTPAYLEHLNRKIDNPGPINADLTIQITQQQTSNHLGIISTNQINKWLQQIPTLRSIILLLKYQISNKGLNQTYTGGLNTYCLVVMIVSFIYHAKLENQVNLAVVLMKVVDFYGWRFQETVYGIDLRNRDEIFYLKGKEEIGKYADLEVKDPLNNGKVMTRNCYAFASIKEVFRNIYTHCFVEKQKLMKEQCIQIKKRLSKRKTKQESQTESGSQKQKLKNYFLDLVI